MGTIKNAGVENVASDDRGGKRGSKLERSVIVSKYLENVRSYGYIPI